jgi:UDP-glucose 4-epimerase
MQMNKSRILLTGGAGFIGSHLADSLMTTGSRVCVLDNLSAGNLANLKQWHNNPDFTFLNIDLTKPLDSLGGEQFDVIYHLAANPEVRVSSTNPETHYNQNITATFNLLEYLRKSGTTPQLVFTSTSAVYGEPTEIPTPETYAPLKPISVYAATKLACEALISAYAYNYGFRAIIYRLANVIGPRSGHGVIYDFIQKLHKTPNQLEILGDGSQTKSYLHVTDCITALLKRREASNEQVEIFNVGSEDKINVKTIAETVIAAMGLTNVDLKLTGGVDGGRGWVGDVKIMLLNADKIKSTGWTPRLNSQQAVTQTARALAQNNPQ